MRMLTLPRGLERAMTFWSPTASHQLERRNMSVLPPFSLNTWCRIWWRKQRLTSLTSLLPPGHYKKPEKCNNPEYSRATFWFHPSCSSNLSNVFPISVSNDKTFFHGPSAQHFSTEVYHIKSPSLSWNRWRWRMFENHNQFLVLLWAMIRVPAKSQKSGVRIFSTSNANQKKCWSFA